MFVCPKLKLNTFKDVNVPKPREYVLRYGLAGVPATSYSGEDFSAPIGQSKIDQIMEADAMNRQYLHEESEHDHYKE